MRNIQSLKITTVIVLFLHVYVVSSSRTTSTISYLYEEGGEWSNLLVGSQNKDLPSQYYLCGYSFRQLQWSTVMCNCNCRRIRTRNRSIFIIYKIICDDCPNYFETQTGGFKAIFCHYQNWNDQVVRYYDTGSPNLRGERQVVMCPANHYAGGAVSKSGNQHGVPLGLIGLRLNCITNTLSQSVIVESPQGINADQRNLKQGSFIAGVSVRGYKTGKLVGITFHAEGIPIVSSIKLFEKINVNFRGASQKLVDLKEVQNRNSKQLLASVRFSNQYVSYGNFQINNLITKGYLISKQIRIQFPKFSAPSSQNQAASTYIYELEPFNFNTNITKKFFSSKDSTAYIKPCTQLIFENKILQLNVTVPFVSTVEFSDLNTRQIIYSTVVQGNFKGVANSNVYFSAAERPLVNCKNGKEDNNSQRKNIRN